MRVQLQSLGSRGRIILRRILELAIICICVGQSGRAQEVKLLDRTVQIHGFASQGFIHTDNNNWLTTNSADEVSGEFTDFGVNATTQVTDKFRIGAQIYDRNLGKLGRWHPSLDWAVASYKLRPWLGVRAGKVKTVIGLLNDTQDLDFLHPFALLPQSIYPTDLRESTISHWGGDFFGDIPLGRAAGHLSYTAYAGMRRDSHYGGYPYLLKSPPPQINFRVYGGLQYGGDLRWTTPLKGLLLGVSRMNEDINGDGTTTILGPTLPYHETSKADWTNQYYGQYVAGKLELDAEYRRYWRDQMIFSDLFEIQTDVRGWYFAGAYRLSRRFQVGSYYSRYSLYSGDFFLGPTSGHTYDKVVTARVDFNTHFDLKVEGHFMDGVGVPGLYPDGFYYNDNPRGLKRYTNALVVKSSFNF